MMYPCRDQEIIVLDEVTHKTHDIRHMPRDQGMVLDAANIARLGDTWLFLESYSGNRAAYDWLVKKGYNPQLGARPMNRTIHEFIKVPLAKKILFDKSQNGVIIKVDANDNGIELEVQDGSSND